MKINNNDNYKRFNIIKLQKKYLPFNKSKNFCGHPLINSLMKTDTIKEEKINFLLCNKENENNLNKNNPNERQYNEKIK